MKDAAKEDDYTSNKPNNQIVSSETEEVTETETEVSTEEVITPPVMVYSESVKTKVMSMSLEEKIAQMFVTTPEQLTGSRKVTATGNTTKAAISEIPVGGLVYSASNFSGKAQTATMTQRLQEYYTEKFGVNVFLAVAEPGGENGSVLAKTNGYAVEKSFEEVFAGEPAESNVEATKLASTNIITYLKEQGFNTNIGINGTAAADSDEVKSALGEVLSVYKEAGVYTATTVYHENSDMVLLGETQSLAEAVHTLRYDNQYLGIVFANVITDAEHAVAAINAGADMVYCETEFKNIYQAVIDAANAGTINEEVINEAVMRILTYKGYE
jgi:beta-N-acetylhexosaminidase